MEFWKNIGFWIPSGNSPRALLCHFKQLSFL